MKIGWIVMVVFLSLLTWGCDKALGLDEYDTGEEYDQDYDTDTRANGDYWADGYCPLLGDSIAEVSNDCRGIPAQGCCDGNGNVLVCQNLNLFCLPCAPQYHRCAFVPEENLHQCEGNVEDTEFDPATAPRSCDMYITP